MNTYPEDEIDVLRPQRRRPPEKYIASTWLANSLFVLGWLILGGAIIGGIVYGLTFECGSFEEDCSQVDAAAVMIAIWLGGLLYAVLTWVAGFVLRLLIDLEMNTARQTILLSRFARQGESAPQRPANRPEG